MTKPLIFIDGEAGTTGLEIRKRLENRTDIDLISINPDRRKDVAERRRLLNAVNLAILCLPDEGAKEAVTLITNSEVKVIDASTAHRVTPGWVYGFPELTKKQPELIRASKRVANPGCYPTGALALLRPISENKLLAFDAPITITAISGYSGGGKDLIAVCEKGDDPLAAGGFAAYGIDQRHKHIPEITNYGLLGRDPVFLPSYSGAFYRGMLIEIALREENFRRIKDKKKVGEQLQAAYLDQYIGEPFIKLVPLMLEPPKGFIVSPLTQNETNNVEIRVIWNAEKEVVVLLAVLDNLGKGASGAAVQNMDLMLGLTS